MFLRGKFVCYETDNHNARKHETELNGKDKCITSSIVIVLPNNLCYT